MGEIFLKTELDSKLKFDAQTLNSSDLNSSLNSSDDEGNDDRSQLTEDGDRLAYAV